MSRAKVLKKKSKKEVALECPLIPLRDVVIFPYMVIPLFIGRKKSLQAVEKAMAENRRLIVTTQADPTLEVPKATDLFRFGCQVEILQMLKLPDDSLKILVEGKERVKLNTIRQKNGMFNSQYEVVKEVTEHSIELQALKRMVVDLFEEYIKLNRKIPIEIMMVVMNTEDLGRLADIIVAHLQMTVVLKQEMLEAVNVRNRLERIAAVLNKEIEILTLEKQIRVKVKDQIETFQKEYYLREQIKVIQKELGSDDELQEEIEELQKQLNDIVNLPADSREIILKEIRKYERTHIQSPESAVIRSYLDWVLELPWDKNNEEILDLQHAQKTLDKDHYGLEKVKERILEFLAVRQRVDKLKGPILCLVGPPGVGKTSLGRSVASALGREFIRVSLGGVRDEAEIRGHRRTYIGAMPGKIIQALHRAKSKNPLFLLDEIDKLANDFRGDPTSALLEVLDPEQNHSFTDHYINLPFDLTDVFFITTANIIHTVPAALKDRMEVIRISGYTEDEKFHIAKNYLIPKQLKENGLKKSHISFLKTGIETLIRHYTREAGVRNLEREVGSICRKRVKKLVADKDEANFKLSKENVSELLGIPRFSHGVSQKKPLIGTVNGLAWTEVGGVVLVVETALMPGKGKFTITGQVGDVMEESSRAALTWIRSNAQKWNIADEFFSKQDIHIHIPEGATPKDGPSAGITIITALVSLFTGRTARPDFAMTGEITLRGRILPIGGVKEKVLAALSEGIPNVILPAENRKDIEEIPEKLRSRIKYYFMADVQDVLDLVLNK